VSGTTAATLRAGPWHSLIGGEFDGEVTAAPSLAPQLPAPPFAGVDRAAAFAVQLTWSERPIDTARIPPLTIFDEHAVYRVSVTRRGQCWHGLRLGFFADTASAQRMVVAASQYFSSATIVGVSAQERARAAAAEIPAWASRVDPLAAGVEPDGEPEERVHATPSRTATPAPERRD
jgi:hypothetical protein